MRFMAELTNNPILFMYAKDVTKYSKLDEGNKCLRISAYLTIKKPYYSEYYRDLTFIINAFTSLGTLVLNPVEHFYCS